MSAAKRSKQALMLVGLLTVIGVLTLVGVVVYLWWDTKGDGEEFEADADFEPETDVEAGVDQVGDDGGPPEESTDSTTGAEAD